MAKKHQSDITLANLIAVVGIVLLMAAFVLGFLYSGDTLGISIAKGVGLGCAFALLLWLLIKAKSADSYLKGWRIVEGITLVVYLALAVLTSCVMMKFINIYVQKSDIQSTALNDIDAIRQEIEHFKDVEGTNINSLSDKLSEVVSLGTERYDTSVRRVLEKCLPDTNVEEIDEDNIDQNVRDFYLEKIKEVSSDNGWEEQLDDCSGKISSWNILEVPQHIKSIPVLAEEVTAKLNELSEDIPCYDIEDDGHVYTAREGQKESYSAETEIDSKMKKAELSPWGIGACVLIHLLILFNYFVTSRTDRRRPVRNTDWAKSGQSLQ